MSAWVLRASVVSGARQECTYSNLTPSGSLSPTCRGAIMINWFMCVECRGNVRAFQVEVQSERESELVIVDYVD
jgi:hypothetical protein